MLIQVVVKHENNLERLYGCLRALLIQVVVKHYKDIIAAFDMFESLVNSSSGKTPLLAMLPTNRLRALLIQVVVKR